MSPETLPVIELVPASEETRDDVLHMLCEASRDPYLVDATYLPAEMDADQARRWVAERSGNAWVLLLDGAPVGWYEIGPVHSSCGFPVPHGTMEREVWLLERGRGRRVIQRSTELLADELTGRGIGHLLAVTWDTNQAAVRGLRNAGAERLGRGFWEHPDFGGAGWCEVWLVHLPEPAGITET